MRRLAIAVFAFICWLLPELAVSQEAREFVDPTTGMRLRLGIPCIRTERSCHGPCATWARGQPDVAFSLDACIAKCLAEERCTRTDGAAPR